MTLVAMLNWFLYERHPLLGIFARRFGVPVLVGFAIGQLLGLMPDWVTLAVVIAANIFAALVVYLVIFKRRR